MLHYFIVTLTSGATHHARGVDEQDALSRYNAERDQSARFMSRTQRRTIRPELAVFAEHSRHCSTCAPDAYLALGDPWM